MLKIRIIFTLLRNTEYEISEIRNLLSAAIIWNINECLLYIYLELCATIISCVHDVIIARKKMKINV